MTTKQREAISTIWQLFRDYFEEGSGSLRSNDDDLIEQLDIYAREEKVKMLEGLIDKNQRLYDSSTENLRNEADRFYAAGLLSPLLSLKSELKTLKKDKP